MEFSVNADPTGNPQNLRTRHSHKEATNALTPSLFKEAVQNEPPTSCTRRMRKCCVCDCTSKMRPACRYALEAGQPLFTKSISAGKFAWERFDEFMNWMSRRTPGLW